MDALYHFLTNDYSKQSQSFTGRQPLIAEMVATLLETTFRYGTKGQIHLIASQEGVDYIQSRGYEHAHSIHFFASVLPRPETEWILLLYTDVLAVAFATIPIEMSELHHIAWSFDPAVVHHALSQWLPTSRYANERSAYDESITPVLDYQVLNTILAKWGESEKHRANFSEDEGLGWDILYVFEYDDSPQMGKFQVRHARPDKRLGYTLKQLNEIGWQRTVHPQDMPQLIESNRRNLLGETTEIHYRIITPSGETFWIQHLSRPEVEPLSNKVVRSYGYMRDVTEQKAAEQRLQASEQRYRELYEKAPVMYALIENRDGYPYIIDCNETFLHTLGYSRAELLNKPIDQYVTAETLDEIVNKGGFMRGMAGDLQNATRDLVKKNGDVIRTLVEALPYKDENGQVLGVRAQYVDVTQRHEAERKVRESEARYRDIFENSPAMYVILQDKNGVPTIIDCNTRFLRVLGYERHELIGQPSSLVYADPLHRMYKDGGFNQAARFGYLEGEKELRTKGGQIVPTRVDGVAFYDADGNFAGVRIAMIGIADLKHVEQKLQQANSELEQRVQERTASLAHANRQMNAQIHQMQKVENELRDSRNRLLYFYENVSDLIHILQANGNIVYVNQAWQKTMGYQAEEVIGKYISTFLEPTTIATQGMEYHTNKNQGINDYATEVTMVTKDGKQIELEASITLQVENGELIQSLSVMRNVTARRVAERESVAAQTQLLESRNRLLYLYENATDLIHTVTFDNPGHLSYVNRKWLLTMEYSAEEVLGRSILEFFAVEEHQKLRDMFFGNLNLGITNWTMDSVMVTKSGKRVEVETSFSVSVDDKGNPGETLAILRDVTAQRRTKREQDIIEARYRNIVQSLPNTTIVLFDTELRYILVDGLKLESYGLQREMLIGQTYPDLMQYLPWYPQLDAVLNAHRATLKGQSSELEFPFLDRIMRLQFSPLHSESEITGGMLIATDITLDRQREQQLLEAKEAAETAAQTKNFFLANMSHEIRTPLNGIVGFTRLLAETVLTPEQKEYASVIIRSSDTLLNLLNDILDFSKIEAERLELAEETFHVSDLLAEVEEIYAPQAFANGLDFNSELDLTVPEYLVGDVIRIRQIMMNLFSNALKFTARGSILLRISGEQKEDGQYLLQLTLKDTGIGISIEQQRVIFETFTQADVTTTRRYGGTGLGLAICKRLAEVMGGDITVYSVPGQGSTFMVTITCPIVTDLPNQFPHAADRHLAGKAILLVMPATSGQIFARLFQKWGLKTTLFVPVDDTVPPNWEDTFDFAIFEQDMDGLFAPEQFYALMTDSQNRGIRTFYINRGASGQQWDGAETDVTVMTKPIRPARLYQFLMDALPESLASAPPPAPPSRLNSDFALEFPLRILLAEDNAVNQQVILAILRRLGYQPDLARDGKEALTAIQKINYDIVLMDIQMPMLSGVEATQQIRALKSRIHQPRIIALTANVLAGQRESYLAAGMDSYLSKPLDIGALLAVLAQTSEEKPILQATKGFNPLALAELREALGEEGEEMVRQVATIYVEELPERLLRIQVGRTVARWDEVSQAAHALKGSSSTVGATDIAATCAEIEAAIKVNAVAAVPSLVSRLAEEVAQIKVTLKPLVDPA